MRNLALQVFRIDITDQGNRNIALNIGVKYRDIGTLRLNPAQISMPLNLANPYFCLLLYNRNEPSSERINRLVPILTADSKFRANIDHPHSLYTAVDHLIPPVGFQLVTFPPKQSRCK